MTKKKFSVVVTRTDEYEVEIDTGVWNKEGLEAWSSVFNDVENHEELAQIITERIIHREGSADDHEGFGRIPLFKKFENETQRVPQSDNHKYSQDLSVTIISETEDVQYEVNEIEAE